MDKESIEGRDRFQKKYEREILLQQQIIGLAHGYAPRSPAERARGEHHGKRVNNFGWKMPFKYNNAALDTNTSSFVTKDLESFGAYFTMLLLVAYEIEARENGFQTGLEG